MTRDRGYRWKDLGARIREARKKCGPDPAAGSASSSGWPRTPCGPGRRGA